MTELPSNTRESTTLYEGILYIVATPIGHLGDMTQRGLQTLGAVDYIAAEDTRHSARLLTHFNITTPVLAYHDHSDQKKLQKILDDLCSGQQVALISDAGTPLISDPGYPLVAQARRLGIRVVPIPGACAVIAALSVAGLPCERFSFEGFLPAKSTARQAVLHTFVTESRTVVVYESTHRLRDTLADMAAILGTGREIALARELTKTYETVITGTVEQVIQVIKNDANQTRGEFVVIIKGHRIDKQALVIDESAAHTMQVLLAELSVKQAAAIGAKLTGLKKRDLYQWAIAQ